MTIQLARAAASDGVIAAAGVLTAVAVAVVVYVQSNIVGWSVVVLLVLFLPVPVVAAAIVRSQPGNPVGWILAGSGLALPFAASAALYARAGYAATPPLPGTAWAGWLDGWPWTFALTTVPTLGLLLFPTGRLPTRRWRPALWLCWIMLVTQLVSALFGTHLLDFPLQPNPTALPGTAGEVAEALGGSIVLVPPLATLAAWSVHRRRVTDPKDRSLAIVAPAGWSIAASWWACGVLIVTTGSSDGALPAEALGMLVLALACWVAVRRYGLFDIRRVVNRTLVYASLSLSVLVVYLAVAAIGERIATTQLSRAAAVVMAVLIALPLRQWLQSAVNRLMYGDRDDPYAAIERIGARLEDAASPEEVMASVVRSIRDALRVPFVSITVDGMVTTNGDDLGAPKEHFPLLFAGENIGALAVELRDPRTALTWAERRMLTGVARQTAAAAQAAMLTTALQRSRERVVKASEDERLRLRRDLHDGLGPALAGIVLGLHRARGRLETDPRSAEDLLVELTQQTKEAVRDVRRLVYGLRPPALDELGLVGALTEQAKLLGPITVHGPDHAFALPAAAEVAAYRIALEAMTNTVRHSGASETTVTISVDHSLHVEIADNGSGVPDAFRAGVGMTSMRERAAELGGHCGISHRIPSGTVVLAVIPLEAA